MLYSYTLNYEYEVCDSPFTSSSLFSFHKKSHELLSKRYYFTLLLKRLFTTNNKTKEMCNKTVIILLTSTGLLKHLHFLE